MKKIRTLSGRVLISLISIVSVSFIFLAIGLSYWSYETMAKEYRQIVQAYIANVNTVFNRCMKEGQEFAERLYTSSGGVNARHMEREDAAATIRLLLDVRDEMSSYYQSVIILNVNGEVSFQARNGTSFPLSLEDNLETLALEQGLGIHPVAWQTQSLYSEKLDITLCSLFMQEAQVGERHYAGSVIINLDAEYLSRALFADISNSGFEVYIVNKNGIVIAHSGKSGVGTDHTLMPYMQTIIGQESGNTSIKVGEDIMEATWQETDWDGFYVVVRSASPKILMNNVWLIPLILLTAVFFLLVLFIYFAGNRLFKSFNNLTFSLRHEAENNYGIEKIYDDVQFLQEYSKLTNGYRQRMLRQEEKNTIAKSIIMDTWTRDMQQFFVEKEFAKEKRRYCAAILQLYNTANENISDCLNRREKVTQEIEKQLSELFKVTCLELGVRRILIILSDETEEDREQTDILLKFEQMRTEMERKYQIKFDYGISKYSFPEKTHLDSLYMEAAQQIDNKTAEEKEDTDNAFHNDFKVKSCANQIFMEKVVDYLNNHYQDNDINVSRLAQEFAIDNAYMGKLFLNFTGKSMSNYLLEVRMKRAKELLMTHPEWSVGRIAEEVGFSSSGYFTTQFKKFYGVSPSRVYEFGMENKEV